MTKQGHDVLLIITLTCPDGEFELIDLRNGIISDKDWLQNQLPNYCMKNCDELYTK